MDGIVEKFKGEWAQFSGQSRNFRVLILTNFIYAFVLPVIDIFVAAYIMRNSSDPKKVIIYQLMIYSGIPLTFLINGFLIRRFNIKWLYSIGMLLSGLSMAIMMSLKTLDIAGIAVAGLTMGMSFGFYWANRDFLSLANTKDENRNYYYGLETFLYTMVGIVIPLAIGWFIQYHTQFGTTHDAYVQITAIVFLITIFASVICFTGEFESPRGREPFVFFKFHPLWTRFLGLAALKGMVQGFLVTAPAMLVMKLLGGEGVLGAAQSIGAVVAAIAMYLIGRYTRPEHRLGILAAGLGFFFLAAVSNGILFNATGVLLFMLFLLLAKPLLDLAYFPIQYRVINVLSAHERRPEYAYILNHETGIYAGRLFGAVTFLVLAYAVSNELALRYAILIVAMIQLLSWWIARGVLRESEELSKSRVSFPQGARVKHGATQSVDGASAHDLESEDGLSIAPIILSLAVFVCGAMGVSVQASAQVAQATVPLVTKMPARPMPFEIIDYHALAQKFDHEVYDFNAPGPYWPLIWKDDSRKNFDQTTFGLYTAMGDVRQGPLNNNGMYHESLASMGAILGASLVGVDKAHQDGNNYVGALKNYFNRETGWNIMQNNTTPLVGGLGGGYARDWWYDLFPNLLFYGIVDQYPHEADFDTIARTIADQFYQADSVLKGNYNSTFFDYGKMQPGNNWICPQPDAAAGHAWVLHAAYQKFGDARYLKGAISAETALLTNTGNPSFEVLLPFGAYTAARLNAEENQNFDVLKVLNWFFETNAGCRSGWGVLSENWNGYDTAGLVGNVLDHGGYGFLMDTYDAAWPLVPMVRYDASYANVIGKWMLNAANATRFFYPDHIPADHQTLPQLAGLTKGVIGYEGLVRRSTMSQYEGIAAPVAQGDGPSWNIHNPEISQYGVYGSAHVGIFGAVISQTDREDILRLDLLATDFFHARAYPTYLYYNPAALDQVVRIEAPAEKLSAVSQAVSNSDLKPGRRSSLVDATTSKIKDQKFDLYDTVSQAFVAKDVVGPIKLSISAQSSRVLVWVPSGGLITHRGRQTLSDGVVIDYGVPTVLPNALKPNAASRKLQWNVH